MRLTVVVNIARARAWFCTGFTGRTELSHWLTLAAAIDASLQFAFLPINTGVPGVRCSADIALAVVAGAVGVHPACTALVTLDRAGSCAAVDVGLVGQRRDVLVDHDDSVAAGQDRVRRRHRHREVRVQREVQHVVERVGVGGGVPLMIIRDERVGVPERVVFDVIVVASNPQSANIDHWYAVMSAVALARAARASLRGRGVAAVYL